MQTLKIEAFHIIGIAIKTTNENEKAANDIAKLWGKFIAKNIADKIPNKVNNDVYSLYTDYEGDHTKPYTAILGCKVESLDDIPIGMVSKSFSKGTYVKTIAKGNLMEGLVVNHWSEIFNMNLQRKYDVDFEIFGEKAQNPSKAEVDFYVGIEEI